jgi:hypothetical protein
VLSVAFATAWGFWLGSWRKGGASSNSPELADLGTVEIECVIKARCALTTHISQ